ncbi:hypothetical protein ABW19_dt0200351 [Dactylella cylindrospora]|nr:hypothetical protein ABW19_dt0200351 [Dactylella cylindrospora]
MLSKALLLLGAIQLVASQTAITDPPPATTKFTTTTTRASTSCPSICVDYVNPCGKTYGGCTTRTNPNLPSSELFQNDRGDYYYPVRLNDHEDLHVKKNPIANFHPTALHSSVHNGHHDHFHHIHQNVHLENHQLPDHLRRLYQLLWWDVGNLHRDVLWHPSPNIHSPAMYPSIHHHQHDHDDSYDHYHVPNDRLPDNLH